ncbi:MAG: methyltransferase domain-containing protein [bacterium]|nr:methyltransferase domain-containing protein [bacterium]
MNETPTGINQLTGSLQKAFIKNYFEEHALNWQNIYSEKDLHSLIIQERSHYVLNYIDNLHLKKGAKILDLGCGAGLTSVSLLLKGFDVCGIDISEKMLGLAEKNCIKAGLKCKNVFRQGSVEGLDFEDNTFDVVVAMGLIEYLKWDRWALQEMYRILKPGGHLIVTVPNMLRLSYVTNPKFLFSLLKKTARKILPLVLGSRVSMRTRHWLYSKTPKLFARKYTPAGLKNMLKDLEFDIVNTVSHGFGPFFILDKFKGLSLKLNDVLQKWSKRKTVRWLSESGSDYIVLCSKSRKTPEVKDIDTFKSREKKLFLKYNLWIRKHPKYLQTNFRPLEEIVDFRENTLVLSPHPDDEIIGCGGTLLQMLKSGAKVTVLQITDGSDTLALSENMDKAIRPKEAKIVAEKLGIKELILWEEDACCFKFNQKNVTELSCILKKVNPKIIFVPFINEQDPHHIIANKILAPALEEIDSDNITIVSYEVYSLLPPNVFCVIDKQFKEKENLLMKYRTGMKVFDYVHFCKLSNFYRSYTLLGKKGFAEAFLAMNVKDYKELVRV